LSIDDILSRASLDRQILSLGVVDGRNIWKNDFEQSLSIIHKAVEKIGAERVWLAPSCSLLHSPIDLDFEQKLNPEIKQWLAFAQQKLLEVSLLTRLAQGEQSPELEKALQENILAHQNRKSSRLIHNQQVKERVASIMPKDFKRNSDFATRQKIQKERFKLPMFPTTTIGSFPQTPEIRQLRAKLYSIKSGFCILLVINP
jgi:5-methyltetrahydropteroyltriglutamate--homocysteine methyltransferase